MDDPTARTPDPANAPPAPSGPSWSPRRERRDEGRWASSITGLIVLAIGLWFFADHTLGLDMPLIRWSQLWPLFLIGVGAMIVLNGLRRGRR